MDRSAAEPALRAAVAGWLLVVTLPHGAAADPPEEPSLPAHVVIAERKLELLQQRIAPYAARGYRYLGASEGRAGMFQAAPLQLHFARSADEEPRSYRIEAGSYSARLEDRLNRAAALGYRVREDGVLKRVAPRPLAEREDENVVFVLERDGRGPPSEYRLLDVSSPKQFRQRIDRALEQGFRIRGMRAFYRGWLLLVLERPVTEQMPQQPAGGVAGYYRLIDEVRRDRLFERLEAAVSEGYRVLSAAAGASVGGGNVVLLERAASPDRRYAYWSLDRTETTDLERRLNQGGREGYRFRPGIRPPFDLLMEQAPGEPQGASYRVIEAGSDSAINDSLTQTLAAGFAFVGMYEDALVLERLGAVTRP